MTADEIRQVVLDILGDIAPDEDLSKLHDDIPFREQLELDSMDFLDIVMELRKRYRIQHPRRGVRRAGQYEQHGEVPRAEDERQIGIRGQRSEGIRRWR